MREVGLAHDRLPVEAASFLACLATILEFGPDQLPDLADGEDPATGWTIARWLGGLGLGLARVANPASFSWAGPWIARVRQADAASCHYVVMYGVPSGVVWDPTGTGGFQKDWIEDGFLVAAADIALARPPRATAPSAAGIVEAIWVATAAGAPMRSLDVARALQGRGLEGDRHVLGTGTFPSGLPGSAVTLIGAEVCESFDPPLAPNEHRRNVLTRGIDLNGLVGRQFTIGGVRFLGMRLCEPCMVVERYASRPVLRALVHRGGLRADVLEDGQIRVGDDVTLTLEGRPAIAAER